MPATWAENIVELELKLSNQNGRENQTKMRWVLSAKKNIRSVNKIVSRGGTLL